MTKPCPKCRCKCVPLTKIRNYHRTRLYQVRGNLTSMIDSAAQDNLLTKEEILQLQRSIKGIDRVIELFNMRSMDLKREGVL